MGNLSSIMPGEMAINLFRAFINECQKRPDAEKLLENDEFNHAFAVYVEDILVNNKLFQLHIPTAREVCIANICLLFALYLQEQKYMSQSESSQDCAFLIKGLCEEFPSHDGPPNPIKDMLKCYIEWSFRWDGTSFYHYNWERKIWVPCTEAEITCESFGTDIFRLGTVSTFGLQHTTAQNGVKHLNEYIIGCRELIPVFKEDPAFDQAFTQLKQNPTQFNQDSNFIPCATKIIDADTATLRDYRFIDYFTQKLEYDPTAPITEVVEQFVTFLNCKNSKLASFIIRCGTRMKYPTLTLITGPASCGKSSFMKVIQTLYGLYAGSATQVTGYKDVRVSFAHNSDILANEEAIRDHPCSHLVVSCLSSSIGSSFGGRVVQRLELGPPNVQDSPPDPNIVAKLTTHRQLNSLLWWAFKEYAQYAPNQTNVD